MRDKEYYERNRKSHSGINNRDFDAKLVSRFEYFNKKISLRIYRVYLLKTKKCHLFTYTKYSRKSKQTIISNSTLKV